MKKLSLLCFPILCAVLLLAADESRVPSLPHPVTSNAVASLKNGTEIFSMMGIGPKRTWDDINDKLYILHSRSKKWVEGRPVPGVAGRLGASAVGVKEQVFLFGGYDVDGEGKELTVGDVNSYVIRDQRWYRAADIPVPVDSAVIGVNRDRYIYLIGGRSNNGPANNVQVYDVQKNTWSQATPSPGTPVFGHAGGLIDDTIVYVDGATRDPSGGKHYMTSDECWIGKIDHKDPKKIEWSKLPPHPGKARFGIVAGGGEHKILFSGGAMAPYNYKGVAADGKPAKISQVTFAFNLHGNSWDTIDEATEDARADVRGMVWTLVGPLVIGGTGNNAVPSADVLVVPKK